MDFIPIAGGAAALALVFAFVKYGSIMKRDAGDAKMQEISKQIQDGAAAFLKAEYKWLAVFVVVVGAAIFMSDAEQGGRDRHRVRRGRRGLGRRGLLRHAHRHPLGGPHHPGGAHRPLRGPRRVLRAPES